MAQPVSLAARAEFLARVLRLLGLLFQRVQLRL
jgi:hypothetical protein